MRFLLLSLFAFQAFGVIIPADRRITWEGNVGIPGGVPNRTIIFANVKDAPYNAVGDGVNDDTAEIQAALNACPSNQVVYIPTGTYKVTSSLVLKNGYTVRGDGTNTVIDARGTAYGIFNFGTINDNAHPWYPTPTYLANIVSGSDQGSTNILLSNTNGFTVGCYVQIDCSNDTSFVNYIGNGGSATWVSRDEGRRALSQIVEVTSISGSNVIFTPPLYWWYTNSPQAIAFTMGLAWAGIEDLRVYANNTGYNKNFQMFGNAYCWLKNIDSDFADGDHVWTGSSYRCEIRDSYFHDGFLHTSGSTDDCVRIASASSGFLVENNIFRRQHVGLMLEWGGGGHVIAYNYFTNQFDQYFQLALFNDIAYHGAHVTMTLFEGNVLNSFNQDGTWGTSSHGTLLRNIITGQNYTVPPVAGRGAEDPNPVNHVRQYQGARTINLAGFGQSKYFNVVGNLLGLTNMGKFPQFSPEYTNVWPETRNYDWEGYVFSLGYANGSDSGGNPNDNNAPYLTLINHGNWDAVNKAIMWDSGIADRGLPQSYYLTSKPSFFYGLEWPPYNPTNTGGSSMSYLNLPAGFRKTFGTNPPAEIQGPIVQPTSMIEVAAGTWWVWYILTPGETYELTTVSAYNEHISRSGLQFTSPYRFIVPLNNTEVFQIDAEPSDSTIQVRQVLYYPTLITPMANLKVNNTNSINALRFEQ